MHASDYNEDGVAAIGDEKTERARSLLLALRRTVAISLKRLHVLHRVLAFVHFIVGAFVSVRIENADWNIEGIDF